MRERLLPQSLESEQSVLGGALISHEAAALLLERVEDREAFYPEMHRRIYDAIRHLRTQDPPISVDILTVPEQLRSWGVLDSVGGMDAISSMAANVVTAAHQADYLDIVLEKWARRRLIQAGEQITRAAFDEAEDLESVLSASEQLVLQARPLQDTGEFIAQGDTLDGLYDYLADGQMDFGVPTGLGELDWLTSGWQKTDLIIVAGRPGMGKTQALLHFARSAALQGVQVCVFSLEMSKEQLGLRQIAWKSRIDMSRLRRKWDLTDAERAEVFRATAELKPLPIVVNDRGDMGIDRMRALARRWRRQHPGKALILVDYLQRMPEPPGAQNENVAVEVNARGLKSMAKELGLPVIALSQLSRANERREDKRPNLTDLRSSGGIEQEADVVVFLHRPDYYANKDTAVREQVWPQRSEFIFAKHRNGALGTIHCQFDGRYGDFLETDERWSDDDVPPETGRGGY